MYTRSMETIYLSLVYTGSWGYLFQKSPVSNGSPNCLFIIIFCHFFVSQDWVSPIHLHNCIILLQETVRKTEMNSVIIFPSNNRKRSNASCSHSFYVLLEVQGTTQLLPYIIVWRITSSTVVRVEVWFDGEV